MKRNLLSSAIIVAIMALGLTGCDDKKAETETPRLPIVNLPHQLLKLPLQKQKLNLKHLRNRWSMNKRFSTKKWMCYIKCYNKLQIPVQSSLARYADWLKDFKQGPTGEERTVYGIYGISESNLAECEKGVKSAVALTPALQPIDGVAVSYIDAAVALGNTINEMDKYYTQENYKDDAFAKGKTLHQTFLKNLEAFEPVAESYHAAIQEINDKRQLAELKNIEEREGKTFHYYSLAVMISAKQINNLISQEKFDVDAAMKKVSELETLVAQAKEADKGGMNFSFINSAGQYQLEAKKYVRRIRDKVPYSDWDKEQLQDANSSWMVEDSFPRALREYNEMVDDYNSLR